MLSAVTCPRRACIAWCSAVRSPSADAGKLTEALPLQLLYTAAPAGRTDAERSICGMAPAAVLI